MCGIFLLITYAFPTFRIVLLKWPETKCAFDAKANLFYRNAVRGLSDRNAVCPSVRPSVPLSVCPSNACIVTKRKHLAKKSSIMTNRKSTTSLPMSLRWTAYVAPNPQRGPQRRQFFCFPYRKLDISRTMSATKFLCVKTFSGKVVRHSLAYLFVHKLLVGDVPFYLKWSKVTHPLLKRRFPVYIRA